jgi:SAM-dependent methyltransferase
MNPQEWHLGKLLETSSYYWKSCTLHAGVKLDLFTAIGTDELTVEDILKRVTADRRGLTRLLDALSAMGLLKKLGDKYSNTTAGYNLLSKDSPGHMGYIIMHHHYLMSSWSQLDQAVVTGKSVRKRTSQSDEKARESFLMGMFNMAMTVAPRLVTEIDLSNRRHLLDLGGGPGTYSIQFCMQNPQLKATVFDLPTTRPFAEKTIERFGLSDRIDFVEGDFTEGDFEGSYDVAWLSHILHAEGPEECRNIIRKTVSALEPGGTIIIHDFILNEYMNGPLFPAIFSLNMLLGTESGQSYSEQQITDMLSEAGVKDISRIPFDSPNDSGIIAGVIR